MEKFTAKVHDFLDLMRLISYPLSKEEMECNTLKFDVLIYVEGLTVGLTTVALTNVDFLGNS